MGNRPIPSYPDCLSLVSLLPVGSLSSVVVGVVGVGGQDRGIEVEFLEVVILGDGAGIGRLKLATDVRVSVCCFTASG